MRVLRVYHAGRDAAHRARDRALVGAGAEIVLVVPDRWPDGGAQERLSAEPFEVVELPVVRPGDVNRHRHAELAAVRACLRDVRPDLLDLHEEPFSSVCHQWLAATSPETPVVTYTAQNVDKRLPPPFHQFEQQAFRRVRGLYPCSLQAASAARGRGYGGLLQVLPLGLPAGLLVPGNQQATDPQMVLGLVGRLVPEKGVADAVRVLEVVNAVRPARLLVVGQGPSADAMTADAAARGVGDRLEILPWQGPESMATLYARMHVVLVPSRATSRWVEQFGRVAVEAQACGAVVAGYRSGALPEAAGEPAVLVAEGDAEGLARAVTALVMDPADYARRRDAGLARGSRLDWDEVARSQLAFYERVLAAPDGGRRRTTRAEARRQARAEFGATAALAGGATRPFALPVLRRDRIWTRTLGGVIDRVLP